MFGAAESTRAGVGTVANDLPEMPVRKSVAGAAFQVSLELLGSAVVSKPNGNVDFPGLVLRRVEHPALVALIESSLQVGHTTNVALAGIRDAFEKIDVFHGLRNGLPSVARHGSTTPSALLRQGYAGHHPSLSTLTCAERRMVEAVGVETTMVVILCVFTRVSATIKRTKPHRKLCQLLQTATT
jgi:hypothetical protein